VRSAARDTHGNIRAANAPLPRDLPCQPASLREVPSPPPSREAAAPCVRFAPRCSTGLQSRSPPTIRRASRLVRQRAPHGMVAASSASGCRRRAAPRCWPCAVAQRRIVTQRHSAAFHARFALRDRHRQTCPARQQYRHTTPDRQPIPPPAPRPHLFTEVAGRPAGLACSPMSRAPREIYEPCLCANCRMPLQPEIKVDDAEKIFSNRRGAAQRRP